MTRKQALFIFLKEIDPDRRRDLRLMQELQTGGELENWGGYRAFCCHRNVVEETNMFPRAVQRAWAMMWDDLKIGELEDG